MPDPGCILLDHLLARLPGDLTSDLKEVLLAIVQALGRGGGTALDGPAARHVGLSMGDGGGLGLGNGAALCGLGSELLLGGKLRLHCEKREVGWLIWMCSGCTGRVSWLRGEDRGEGRPLSTLLLLCWLVLLVAVVCWGGCDGALLVLDSAGGFS